MPDQRPRFYVKTGYHYWTIMRRHDRNMDAESYPVSCEDAPVATVSARGIGDAAARVKVRAACDAMNEGAS